MKIFTILTFILIMTASDILLSQSITGDGNVVRVTKTLSSFNEIESNGIVDIILKQGEKESAEIETDKNIIPYVEVFVKDNSLHVQTKEDVEIKEHTKLNVYVSFKNIDKIELNGVGNLKSENQLNLSKLNLVNSGVGNVNLNMDCNELILDLHGVGNATLTGKVDNAVINHNGVGNLKAFDLVADVLNIQSNGVGNAEVNSEKEIYISLNGMGNVSYKGNGIVKELSKNGFGNIKKM